MTPSPFLFRKVRSHQTLSERLQAARRLRGIETYQVASAIGVQERYLRWLEEGRFDLLPATVYSRGFLKRYAEHLHLPVDEILALYDHERGVDHHIRKARGEETLEVKPVQAKRTRFLLSPKTIRLALIGLVLLLLIAYVVFQFRSLSAPPELSLGSPTADVTVDASTFTVSGTVEEGSRLLLNGSEVRVAADGIFSVEVPLVPGENRLRFVATSPVGKETRLERTIVVPQTDVLPIPPPVEAVP